MTVAARPRRCPAPPRRPSYRRHEQWNNLPWSTPRLRKTTPLRSRCASASAAVRLARTRVGVRSPCPDISPPKVHGARGDALDKNRRQRERPAPRREGEKRRLPLHFQFCGQISAEIGFNQRATERPEMVCCGRRPIEGAKSAAVSFEFFGAGKRYIEFVGESERQIRSRFAFVFRRREKKVLALSDDPARERHNDGASLHDAPVRPDLNASPAMVDALDLAAQGDPQITAMRGHNTAISIGEAPVHAIVFISGKIARRDFREFGAAVISAHGVDQSVRRIRRIEKLGGGSVRSVLSQRFDLLTKSGERIAECPHCRRGSADMGRRPLPGRQRPVDGTPLVFGDFQPRVLVGGMQPSAPHVEGEAAGVFNRPGSPPRRSRASRRRYSTPAASRTRAAAIPAAPPPTIATSSSLFDMAARVFRKSHRNDGDADQERVEVDHHNDISERPDDQRYGVGARETP